MLNRYEHNTPCGTICYWTNALDLDRLTLVFLPGLTADHTLFDKQIEYFQDKYNVFVWDAPAHAQSRPFSFDFTLKDKVSWLKEILTKIKVDNFVLVGQSMGGYVSQAFMQYFPGRAKGFVCIDSAPLQMHYYPKWEVSLLHHLEPLYRMFPWKSLVKQGAKGTAETPYGQELMTKMMQVYSDNPKYYAKLVGHGYHILAQAIEADLPYNIDCPCLIMCGEKDKAGDTKKFNKKWYDKGSVPIVWIEGAGHNSNTDNPSRVNRLIEDFVKQLISN